MKRIENVILCGLGAVGSVYAEKLSKRADVNFKVLVDNSRYEKYSQNPVTFNSLPLKVKYVLPDEENFKADLILITTKMSGLDAALEQMKNFVDADTIILPLLNGVTSENKVAEVFGREHVLYSYFIGHSSVRTGNSITHDGYNFIVFGSDNERDINNVNSVKDFFDKVGISYKVPDDIKHSMWVKFMLNTSANPTTALFRMNFKQMLSNEKFMDLAVKIMKEVQLVAKAEGVNNWETLVDDALEQFRIMNPEGKTSMLQDVEAGRKTEIDVFAGTVSNLGKKYGIETPYCNLLVELFSIIECNL